MKKPFLYSVIALAVIAAVIFAASFIKADPIHKIQAEAVKAERNLKQRERILDRCSPVRRNSAMRPTSRRIW